MLMLQNTSRSIVFLFLMVCTPFFAYSDHYLQNNDDENGASEQIESVNTKSATLSNKKMCKHKNLSYYLFIEDFVESFIEIPTSNVSMSSTTTASSYLAGRAAVYNAKDEKVGTCSASFLSMQNVDGIYTDISNYLSVDNGLVISWLTPTKPINLALDSIVHSMVTECLVVAYTKIGFNPFYGKTFNMIVSSDDSKIYFKLTEE